MELGLSLIFCAAWLT